MKFLTYHSTRITLATQIQKYFYHFLSSKFFLSQGFRINLFLVLFLQFAASTIAINDTSAEDKVDNASGQFAETLPKIFVSIPPLKYFVRALLPEVEVEAVLNEATCIEGYEPTVGLISSLSKVHVFIKLTESHSQIEDKLLAHLDSKNTKVFSALPAANPATLEKMERNQFIKIENHPWMLPQNGEIILENIAKALKSSYPQRATEIEENLVKTKAEITKLRNDFDKVLSANSNKSFLIFHPTLGELAYKYQLKEISLEDNTHEISAIKILEIKKVIQNSFLKSSKNSNTDKRNPNSDSSFALPPILFSPILIVQPSTPRQQAQSLAKELQGQTREIEPMGEDWLHSMRVTLKVLDEALF